MQAEEAAYRKHWPEVAEKLRQLVQQIWEARREGADPLSGTIRHELIKALREHWGADSYAYKFVQDLCKGK